MKRTAMGITLLLLVGGCGPAGGQTTATTTPARTLAPTTVPTAPTAAPSAGPTAEPTASAPAARLLGSADKGRPLGPGTYRVGAPFERPFTITFALSWSLEALTPDDVQFHYAEGAGHGGAPWLIVDIVDNVFADPCQTGSGPRQPPVDKTVQSVLQALTEMTSVQAGEVESVDINGQPAKTVVLTNTVNTDTTTCTDDQLLWMWTLPNGQKGPGTNGGATERIWGFDVADAVVLFDAETYSNTPEADKAGLDELAETLVFDR